MSRIKAYLYPKPAEFQRQMAELEAERVKPKPPLFQGTTTGRFTTDLSRAEARVIDAPTFEDRNQAMMDLVADAFSEATGIPRDAFTMIAPAELAFDPAAHLSVDEHNPTADLQSAFSRLLDQPLRSSPNTKHESEFDNAWREGLGANPQAPFLWISHKGESYLVRNMATPHLYYSLRMLWNNTVPPVFRVGKFKRYNDIPGWPRDYVKRAITEISKELSTRDLDIELSDTPGTTIAEQLGDILANLDVIEAFGI